MDTISMRSSRIVSIDSRRQRESVVSAILRQELERRKSSKDIGGGGIQLPLAAAFELPGIQISRIETMDFDDGASAGPGSSRSGGGSKRYIIIHSDLSSDFSQLSFTASEHSLSQGSRSSRSRSSRASSNVSSRLWDFSPRESEWDADVSLGSHESQLSVSRADWGGGPSYGTCRDYALLSPSMTPRKGSVVTFDMGGGGGELRRHSSPAPSCRRKSSSAAVPLPAPPSSSSAAAAAETSGDKATTSRDFVPPSALRSKDSSLLSLSATSSSFLHGVGSGGGNGAVRNPDEYRTLNQFRKRSAGDQSIISIRIDEDDGDEENEDEDDEEREERQKKEQEDDDDDEDFDESTPLNNNNNNSTENPTAEKTTTSGTGCDDGRCGAVVLATASGAGFSVGGTCPYANKGPNQRLRALSLKRNNTDDSEVERRVAQIFREIDYSATDSVDESKILSHSSGDQIVEPGVEAETQTLTEQELRSFIVVAVGDPQTAVAGTKTSKASGPTTASQVVPTTSRVCGTASTLTRRAELTSASSTDRSTEDSGEMQRDLPPSASTINRNMPDDNDEDDDDISAAIGGGGGGGGGGGEGGGSKKWDRKRFRLLHALPSAFFSSIERRTSPNLAGVGRSSTATETSGGGGSSSASRSTTSGNAPSTTTSASTTSGGLSSSTPSSSSYRAGRRLLVHLGFSH